jgi:hypothetical protein
MGTTVGWSVALEHATPQKRLRISMLMAARMPFPWLQIVTAAERRPTYNIFEGEIFPSQRSKGVCAALLAGGIRNISSVVYLVTS